LVTPSNMIIISEVNNSAPMRTILPPVDPGTGELPCDHTSSSSKAYGVGLTRTIRRGRRDPRLDGEGLAVNEGDSRYDGSSEMVARMNCTVDTEVSMTVARQMLSRQPSPDRLNTHVVLVCRGGTCYDGLQESSIREQDSTPHSL